MPTAVLAGADGEWREQPPLHREAPAAMYDATHDRMLLVGGVIESYQGDPAYDGATSDVWSLDLGNPTAWTKLAAAGAAPAPVVAPAVILDPVREQIVWVGGAGASMAQVWTLSLSGTPQWTLHAATGTPPAARAYAAVAYDPVRDQLVLCGGEDAAGSPLGDTWTLSLDPSFTWTALSPAGTPPAARSRAAFAYDPPRDRFVLIGGRSGSNYLADVWSLELSGTPTWSGVAPAGGPPDPRAAASLVYDPQDDRFVLFAGGRDYVWLDDLWTLDLSGAPAWAALAPGGGPPSVRAAHAAIFDPLRRQMVVYGGTTFYGTDEGWRLDLSGPPVWSELPMAFDRPDARRGATVIVDAPNQRLVCFGGGAPSNQTWVMPFATLEWSPLATGGTPPPARRYHSAILDPVRRRMIVFGGTGAGGATQFDDVWALPLDGTPDWTQLLPAGSPPGPRAEHAAVYDPGGDRMVVYGGNAGASDYADVWALTLGATPAWAQLFPGGSTPGARSGTASAWDPVHARMIVYGGFAQGGLQYESDTFGLSFANGAVWTHIATGGGPSGRSATATAVDTRRGRLLMFGGNGDFGASSRTNELWAFGFADSAWTQLAPSGFLPSIRSGAVAAYDSSADRMIAYGGFTGVDYSEIDWTLDFADQVVAVPRPRAPAADFALRGAVPNPVRGDFVVAFRLPDAAPARLEVFDVAGRRVAGGEVGPMGAGPHTLRLGARGAFETGVYLVRLSRGDERRVTRAVVLR